jgi:hypothetical protein
VGIRILSAEHGLIRPDTPILPYDRRMTPDRARQLRGWASNLSLAVFEEEAGEVYLAMGATYRIAVHGLFPGYVRVTVGGAEIGMMQAALKSGSASRPPNFPGCSRTAREPPVFRRTWMTLLRYPSRAHGGPPPTMPAARPRSPGGWGSRPRRPPRSWYMTRRRSLAPPARSRPRSAPRTWRPRPTQLARFAAAHPNPPGTSPYSGAAVQRTIRTMGRTGLPLPHAWARIRGQLEDERGGQSAAAAFHRDGTTFVVVHDSRRAPLDPAGMRTIYAWDSSADGPALGSGDDPNPEGRKGAG